MKKVLVVGSSKVYLQSYTVSSKKQKRNPIENKLSTGCDSAGIKMLLMICDACVSTYSHKVITILRPVEKLKQISRRLYIIKCAPKRISNNNMPIFLYLLQFVCLLCVCACVCAFASHSFIHLFMFVLFCIWQI